MKFIGFAFIVFAGLTAYWAITGRIAGVAIPNVPLPPSGAPPASTTPLPGAEGGSAATGPLPGTQLFGQLFPSQSSAIAPSGVLNV